MPWTADNHGGWCAQWETAIELLMLVGDHGGDPMMARKRAKVYKIARWCRPGHTEPAPHEAALMILSRYRVWSQLGCGSGPSWSSIHPKSRMSIQPPHALHRKKCSASGTCRPSVRSPTTVPRGLGSSSDLRSIEKFKKLNALINS
jgi:hypothetical protein